MLQAVSEIQSGSAPNLNPEQQRAVEHYLGPILVLAGAGSGKTRVITHRIAHLIREHGVHPAHILAVTFTNKATEEMRERLGRLLGDEARDLWIATFHSTALRILRRHASLVGFTNDFLIYDEDDCRALIKNILKKLELDEKKYPPARFLRAIDKAKNEMFTAEELSRKATFPDARLEAEVYDHFQRALKSANAMDFGDLLFRLVQLLEKYPEVLAGYQEKFKFILVDEFQDTNAVQYRFLKLISARYKNVLVVGDDDQSIYSFRGADISNILNFEKDFQGTQLVKLEQNYRSTGTILSCAHAVIEKNRARKPKKLWTEGDRGSKILTFVADDEGGEARFIASHIRRRLKDGLQYKDVAIFYRTNAQSRALEEALLSSQIPYVIFGGLKFYERKEIKDIIAYLRLVLNPNDVQAFQRTVNTPPRGVGEQTVQVISDSAAAQGLSLYVAAQSLVAGGMKSKGVQRFVEIIETLKTEARTTALSELFQRAIELSEYETRLKTLKDPTVQSRIENLRELVAIGRGAEYSALSGLDALRLFLDKVSLSTSAELPEDELVQGKPNRVSLMTLHLAKGLEFPLVFLPGLEEGLLPHYRSIEMGDPTALEEERRLCYVGITRAMRELVVTRAAARGFFSAGGGLDNSSYYRKPSRFAADFPEECLNHLSDAFSSSSEPAPLSEDRERVSSRRHIEPPIEMNADFGPGISKALTRALGVNTPVAKRRTTALVQSADALKSEGRGRAGEPADPSSLSLGDSVIHPMFGTGLVEGIEGELTGPSEQLRVIVRFPGFTKPKQLIWKFAGLRRT